jgi:hypothetical protein
MINNELIGMFWSCTYVVLDHSCFHIFDMFSKREYLSPVGSTRRPRRLVNDV